MCFYFLSSEAWEIGTSQHNDNTNKDVKQTIVMEFVKWKQKTQSWKRSVMDFLLFGNDWGLYMDNPPKAKEG